MSELSHLDALEAEAIYIIREVAAECEKPVMLYSIGKDSSVMLHLAMKAFYPEKPPFPFLHIDTTWKFKDMIRFRDETAKKLGIEMLVYTNEEEGDIAASAEEYIVFSSSALSLDRTRIYYQYLINVADGVCRMTMTRIRYWYDENRDGGEKYTAEEWITDDMALNKKKTKLAPICGKFRRETIDLKDQLFQSATDALGQKVLANETAPAVVPATPLTPAMTLTGELKEVPVAQFSENWNSQLQNGRITLTANDEEIEIKAENWGGFGKLFNKNVAYLLIAQDRIALSALMEQCSEYKISFYAQGASQPTAVIECKKSMNQKMTAEDLKSLNIQADSNKSYTMYTGEITRTQLRQ